MILSNLSLPILSCGLRISVSWMKVRYNNKSYINESVSLLVFVLLTAAKKVKYIGNIFKRDVFFFKFDLQLLLTTGGN